MKDIKLVIWDLDETFWAGTLSEGKIDYIPENHETIIQLCKRGIMNSICSKNDFEQAKRKLEQEGTWKYLVFPRISWNPKGPELNYLIKAMQLRNENVLFIDDNPMNLKEAVFYNPGINTTLPTEFNKLRSDRALAGKNDPGLTRLLQYKLLEKKAVGKTRAGSNEEFLRKSNIRVILDKQPLKHLDRLVELINRSNQLNYTKARVTADDLQKLITSPKVEACSVSVTDNYGDYGISGFYAKEGNTLKQFLFSCRVLDMGVERWLYSHLKKPHLDTVGEVATDLSGEKPDWITHSYGTSEITAPGGQNGSKDRVRLLLKGGCDLDQLDTYLEKLYGVESEFNYVSNEGVPIHTEHSEILRQCLEGKQNTELIKNIPFLDERAFITKFFQPGYNVYVYSALMDYTQGLYVHKHGSLVIPYGDIEMDITDRANHHLLLKKGNATGMSLNFLEWFSENFSFIGGLTPQRFVENIIWMRNQLPTESLLILLNGSEVKLQHPKEGDRSGRHSILNTALENITDKIPGVKICDVRKFVRNNEDITDNIRHYKRSNYHLIAMEITSIISSHFGQHLRPISSREACYLNLKKRLSKMTKHLLERLTLLPSKLG